MSAPRVAATAAPSAATDWREGVALLQGRVASLPDALAEFASRPDPVLPRRAETVRRISVTGVGNSAAHARYLADVLDRELALPARYVPTGALAQRDTRVDRGRDALVVFSQGLSPNARFALTAPEQWASLTLVTATGTRGGARADCGEKAALLDALQCAGATVVRTPGEDEYGTLIRVTGPMLAYAGALAVARAWGRVFDREVASLALDTAAVGAAWRRAPDAVARVFGDGTGLRLERGVTLLASGGYGERAQGWRHKVLEGMGLPWPPLWDVLEFSHGPFQQHAERECEVVMLARADAVGEPALVDAVRRMLDPARQRLRVLDAALPGALAVFEHEAQGNALLLRWLEQMQRDPRRWAGQGRDAPLYERRPDPAAP